MLRITEFIRETLEGKSYRPFDGVILIWNLTNGCNLYCKHCYSSANQERDKELTLEEIKRVADDLPSAKVKFVILSGGEPLLREDLFSIAKLLKEKGVRTYLSTNGLLLEEHIESIKENFDYVGISVDGPPPIHDAFRGKRGAFEGSMKAIRLCLEKGIKVGLRFTLTPFTSKSLPFIFQLVEDERIPKLYISHLVYSGRAKRLTDLERREYKEWVDFIVRKSFEYVEGGKDIDVVTGNNEADAVVLYAEFKRRYPDLAKDFYERLRLWGGNQAGVRLANIDFRGNLKPDPFFFHPLGNLREKSFVQVWNGNGILGFLRERPRRLKGKCAQCPHIEICNGNSRARAYAVFGDYREEDPACYL
jgi:radical SAM protein with 4Fe4S-binding SPASM domain